MINRGEIMKLSLFYGKKVVSTDGKHGYVLSVNAVGDTLVCLRCADDDEKEFFIDLKNIVSIKDKIVYEDREQTIQKSTPLRLGCAGYDENGMFLGNLNEYEYKGEKLLSAKIGKKNYPVSDLACGDVIIVKDTAKLKSDVYKDGEVLIKKGSTLSKDVINKAVEAGEFVQTTMKTL